MFSWKNRYNEKVGIIIRPFYYINLERADTELLKNRFASALS
jgi:hypothetical protein